jgi:hypothetical protein
VNRAAEVNITSANVYWYQTSSLINLHLSRHRVITTMQPRPLQPSPSAGPTFERGISSDDPPEPPHTTYTSQDFALLELFHTNLEGSLSRLRNSCTV